MSPAPPNRFLQHCECWRPRALALLCCLPQGDFPLKADRVVQSVKAICNALAAVETPEITSALNQLPPCPSRMQPKIQKVMGSGMNLGKGTRGVTCDEVSTP